MIRIPIGIKTKVGIVSLIVALAAAGCGHSAPEKAIVEPEPSTALPRIIEWTPFNDPLLEVVEEVTGRTIVCVWNGPHDEEQLKEAVGRLYEVRRTDWNRKLATLPEHAQSSIFIKVWLSEESRQRDVCHLYATSARKHGETSHVIQPWNEARVEISTPW